MLYTLKNEELTVQISDVGAELFSVKRGDCEYIWIGDPNIWALHAPLVFPVCGRFYEAKYTYRGQVYPINLHGFIRPSTLTVESHSDTSICLRLTANEQTRSVYPFEFVLRVFYILDGATLINRFEIENCGTDILPATLGGHPGFNVPLDGQGDFTDYYLEFGNPCSPDAIGLSDSCLVDGTKHAFPLENGKILRLRHDLFDHDAIFLSRADSTVTLKSDKSDRFVTLNYPDMPYVGIWHKPHMEAPYVCIEPWCGLPGYDHVIEDMETRPDMFRIQPNATQTVSFSMFFG